MFTYYRHNKPTLGRMGWELFAISFISISLSMALSINGNKGASSPSKTIVKLPSSSYSLEQLPPRQAVPTAVEIASTPQDQEENSELIDEISSFTEKLMSAYGLSRKKAEKFSEWTLSSSQYNDVPRDILAAVIMTESSFRVNAVSHVGALGPAQVRPIFWSTVCEGDLSIPSDNINCAGHILRHYYTKYCSSDWQCALKHYNVGPTNLRKSHKYRMAGERYLKKVSTHIASIGGSLAQTSEVSAKL